MAPDLAYLFSLRNTSFHRLPGVVLYALPLAALFWAWLELLVLPVLQQGLPTSKGHEWGRWARTRGLPTTARDWAWGVMALALGAGTHVLWDGFTHRYRWPASALYASVALPLPGGRHLGLPNALQLGSHVIGLVLVAGFMRRRYPELSPALPPIPKRVRRVATLSLAGLVAGWVALATLPAAYLHTFGAAWSAFWMGTRGMLLGLSAACVLESAQGTSAGRDSA